MGVYSNFPPNVQFIKNYTFTISIRLLQQKILQQLSAVNRRELSFEEVSIPTIPGGVIIFEFGLAEEAAFNFLSETEAKKAINYVANKQVRKLDFFCAIRYYKAAGEVRQALKFDYFLLRTIFGKGSFEAQLFHERGPRYLSAEDLADFIIKQVNDTADRAILKEEPIN